jgi:hypothetical protein
MVRGVSVCGSPFDDTFFFKTETIKAQTKLDALVFIFVFGMNLTAKL